ncbi:unnamed protein product, partial [Vitis vinifera]
MLLYLTKIQFESVKEGKQWATRSFFSLNMFRGFHSCKSRRISYNSTPTFTTFTASPFPPLKSLLFKPLNPNQCTKSLQDLVDHYKTSTSHCNTTLFSSSETFESLINRYQGSCCSEEARELHLQSIKYGFVGNLFLSNTLINIYVRIGDLGSAQKLFDEMSNRNLVTWACLISGYTQNGKPDEACARFRDMVRAGFIPNHYAFGSALRACQESGPSGCKLGVQIHGLISKTRYGSDVVVCNVLISMYGSCLDSANDARSVFDGIGIRNSISWNSIISVYSRRGDAVSAYDLFSSMQKEGLGFSFKPNDAFSEFSVLEEGRRKGREVHAHVIRTGLNDNKVAIGNGLVNMYAKSGAIADACSVFELMVEKDSVSWNSLISGLDQNECSEDAAEMFSLMPEYDQVSWNSVIGALSDSEASVSQAVKYFLQMMRGGWGLSRVTFINILSAVSSLSLHEVSHQIHALVLKYCLSDDTAIGNALLSCYGKCGEMNECEKIFARMSETRDEVSWNSMISGYIHNELLHKAMDLVWFMMQKGQRLDSFTFATILSACASVATLERGMEVHACGIRACLESDVVVGSALVDMYSKCGRIDYASRFFELMPLRNVYSWNSMISGYARHGHGEKALKLFTRMMLDGQPPDHVTFVGVLSACSHVGFVEEGFEHFKSMSEVYRLSPRVEHFSCMVDLLGRAGKLDEVGDFINSMPMKPNVLIWRTVLGACCRANGRNTELGRRAAEMLLELEPQNAVNYVLLANMYASGEKWEDVAKARTAMKEAAVKKEAGCSWVTMKDGVHVFVAGDKLHPEKDLIYDKLRELNRKMRDAGYIPQTKYALFDLELENKEELLSYHSEKIAVAFVLTRQSALPIRIMKNLRVCGDCHSAFGYISKIVGRQIVLRDSNRFHHFEDGKCSCGDYW